ncbi:MAG: hypothetical protein ACTSYI_05680 [Promethearchaeota archaeon]
MTYPDPDPNPDSDPDSTEDLEKALKDVPDDPNIDNISDDDLLLDDEDDILAEATHMLGGTNQKTKIKKPKGTKTTKNTKKGTPSPSRRKKRDADDLSLDDDPLLAEMEQMLGGGRGGGGKISSKYIPKASFARFPVRVFLGGIVLNLIAAVGLRLPEILAFNESGSVPTPAWGLLIPELLFLGVNFTIMILFLTKPSVSFLLLIGSAGWNIIYEVIVRFVLQHAHPFGSWGSFIFTVVASGLLLYCGYHAVLTIHEI